MAISKTIICAIGILLVACCSVQARRLHETGDVTSKTTIWLDPRGGVLPLAQRVELLAKANADKTAVLLAEYHCKAHMYDGCQEVELLKAAGAKQASSDDSGGDEQTAPCHQNMLASWYFGTHCDLPTFDDALKDPSKYKQVKAAGGKDRRRSRSLMASAMQRLW